MEMGFVYFKHKMFSKFHKNISPDIIQQAEKRSKMALHQMVTLTTFQ